MDVASPPGSNNLISAHRGAKLRMSWSCNVILTDDSLHMLHRHLCPHEDPFKLSETCLGLLSARWLHLQDGSFQYIHRPSFTYWYTRFFFSWGIFTSFVPLQIELFSRWIFSFSSWSSQHSVLYVFLFLGWKCDFCFYLFKWLHMKISLK